MKLDYCCCATCGTPDTFPDDVKSETRPYGPGGSLICVRCGLGTPDAEASTERAFLAISDAEVAATGTHIIEDAANPGWREFLADRLAQLDDPGRGEVL